MDERPLTYSAFQSQANQQVFRYALKQGHLGPLVFLWSLGVAVFILASGSESDWADGLRPIWVFALLWTIIILILAYGMMRSYLGNRQVREQMLRSVLERRCLRGESWDADLWVRVQL